MRLPNATRQHVAGWTGPLIEDAEPDTVQGAGAVDDGVNMMAQAGRRRIVRGGSQVVATFGAVAGNPVTNCWGPFRYSASGCVAVGHVPASTKHYAYALTDTCNWATGTEATSRADLTWNSATAARPLAVELFEKVYFVDATESATRQGMSVGTYAAGAWSVSQPTYDLDASGGSPGVLRGYCAEVFGGVLFVSGYDNETAASSGNAPHLLRHSLLGTDPASSGGFDPNAYAIIGAKGQYIRAMKAGRTVLLVAKNSELYAISGSGRGLPGWHYQIQPVSNSLGAGCTNPYALDHAYGMWYGIGRVGPWRSDGGTVELLRAGRDRSWSRVQNLQLATVSAHPDRRQVWYGFHETGRSGYATAPCTYWVWDIEREQWDVSQRTNRSYTFLGTVLQGATVAPSSSPGAPSQDFTDDALEFASIEVTFVAGDTSANTEVWYRAASSGGYTFHSLLQQGINRARIAGLSPGRNYYVKVRHNTGGTVSDWSGETECFTRVPSGWVSAGQSQTTDSDTNPRTVQGTAVANVGATIAISDSGSPAYSATYAGLLGLGSGTDTSPFGNTYTMTTTVPSWPLGYRDGLTVTAEQLLPSSAYPNKPSQDFSSSELYPNTLAIVWWPHKHGVTYEFYYAPSSSPFSFTLGATYTSPSVGTALTPQGFGMGVPTAGEYYFVKVRDKATGLESANATMFTKLPAPSSVVVTSTGAGTPVVNVAVAVAQAGHKLHIYNADKSYDNLTAGTYSVATHNFSTTGGQCGQVDQYWVRTYDAFWPAGFKYSDPVTDIVTDPCQVGS